MLARLALRLLREVSPRLLAKAGYLWVFKGMRAVGAYKRRVKRGELFPPFLFLALTNACNLALPRLLDRHDRQAEPPVGRTTLTAIIAAGKRQKAWFYTLLGGEPFLYAGLWDIVERHRDCYFQIITNGMFFSEENVRRLRAAGNVTPLVSIDGFAAEQRRPPRRRRLRVGDGGAGSFAAPQAALRRGHDGDRAEPG